MSTRLQVVLSDEEAAALKEVAGREGVTVSEWVRRSLREARRQHAAGSADAKLAAIDAAYQHDFPSGDVDQMLAETERGYAG